LNPLILLKDYLIYARRPKVIQNYRCNLTIFFRLLEIKLIVLALIILIIRIEHKSDN